MSKLTPYLAVCENQEPKTVNLPFNHHEFLIRQSPIRYELRADGGSAEREKVEAELLEMGRKISGLLGSVPGLAASFGADGGGEGLIHLELVFSALELSLVPFEAAISPDGCPGPGQALSLQTKRPVTITRRQRGSTESMASWWGEPKILVVVSNAGGDVPDLANVTALREAIEPWVKPGEGLHGADSSRDLMDILPNASLASIQAACSAKCYTHIHLLAHGASRKVMGGQRFGIALNSPNGKGMHVVSGSELACAIRTHNKVTQKLSSPCCVTIAACDSSNVSSVVPPGGSVAQELHQAGIPFVVGSQFPLSSLGSVVFAKTLYPRLLKGDDPRVALHDVRQNLKLMDGVHDWASIVAYFSQNPGFENELRRQRVDQARRAGKAAIKWAQWLVDNNIPSTDKDKRRFQVAMDWLQQAASPPGRRNFGGKEKANLQAESQGARGEVLGLRGSILKQQADIVRKQGEIEETKKNSHETRAEWLKREKALLEKAQKEYLEGVAEGSLGTVLQDWGNVHWLVTQYLSLTLILTDHLAEDEYLPLAEASCQADLRAKDPTDIVWVHATKAELALLAAFSKKKYRVKDAWRNAISHARSFAEGQRNTFQSLSTGRQFDRYPGWFRDYLPVGFQEEKELALAIMKDIKTVSEGREPQPRPRALIKAVLAKLQSSASNPPPSPTTPEEPPTQ